MKVSETMETLLKKSDNVPPSYELIYRVKHYKGYVIMYHMLNVVTCVTAGTLAYKYYTDKNFKFGKIENTFVTALVIFFLVVTYTFGTITCHRLVLRIYRNPKTKMHRAIFIGKVPFTSTYYDFPGESLTYVSKDSLNPFKALSFVANKDRKLLLYHDSEETFKTHLAFEEMLEPQERDS